jgi:hypothetical protein
MSINSLQDDMSRRAASMAAMAQRMNNPQEIQAMQQRLVQAIQSGAIKPYVGIPLVQELTEKLNAAKAHVAQAMAGAGMPQAQPGGAPIAQEVMQQATQPAAAQGVETLPTNLPSSYAGGGIIAFEGGGEVERFQNKGIVDGSSDGSEIMAAAGTANPFVGSVFQGMFGEDPQWKKDLLLKEELARRARLQGVTTPAPTVNTYSQMKAGDMTPAQLGPVPGSTDKDVLGRRLSGASDSSNTGGPGAGGPGGGGVTSLKLPKFTPTAAPEGQDYMADVDALPAKAKDAFNEARDTEEAYLRSITQPGEEARESRLKAREAGIEKDSAMGRALNLMSLGFGIAGSKERTLAGALGNEGRQGIADLIKGEAANRVAKERLEDARDNFEQQKLAAAKGDRATANTAGDRASNNMQAYTQLTTQAKHYGNTEANQRWQAENQFKGQAVQLEQAGILGLEHIRAQRESTAASVALGREKLQFLQDQIKAGNVRAQATLAAAQTKAAAAFEQSSDFRMAQKQAEKLSPLEAQRVMFQARQNYIANAIPALLGSTETSSVNARDVSEFLKD